MEFSKLVENKNIRENKIQLIARYELIDNMWRNGQQNPREEKLSGEILYLNYLGEGGTFNDPIPLNLQFPYNYIEAALFSIKREHRKNYFIDQYNKNLKLTQKKLNFKIADVDPDIYSVNIISGKKNKLIPITE